MVAINPVYEILFDVAGRREAMTSKYNIR